MPTLTVAGITAAAGLLGAGASVVGAVSSGRQADRSARAQQSQFDQQNATEQERLDFFRQQYSDWQDTFSPVLEQLRTEAFKGLEPDYDAIAADVSNSFDVAQGTERRTMARYGLSPSDGAFGAGEREYGISKALGQVGARNTARIANKNQKFDRMSNFYSLGNAQFSGATQGVNNAFGSSASGAGGRAGSYGNDARYFAGASANNWQAFGSTDWASIGEGISNWRKPPTPPTPPTPPPPPGD